MKVLRQVLESVDESTRVGIYSQGEASGPLAGEPQVEQAMAR